MFYLSCLFIFLSVLTFAVLCFELYRSRSQYRQLYASSYHLHLHWLLPIWVWRAPVLRAAVAFFQCAVIAVCAWAADGSGLNAMLLAVLLAGVVLSTLLLLVVVVMSAPRITAADIRLKYPNPTTCPEDGTGAEGYCVGGALCMAVGVNTGGFPYPEKIAEALRCARPSMPRHVARDAASRILIANDKGRFEDAWKLLDAALDGWTVWRTEVVS